MCKRKAGAHVKMLGTLGQDTSDSEEEAQRTFTVHKYIHHMGRLIDVMPMELNGTKVHVIIDSGSSVNVMGSQTFDKLRASANMILDETRAPIL